RSAAVRPTRAGRRRPFDTRGRATSAASIRAAVRPRAAERVAAGARLPVAARVAVGARVAVRWRRRSRCTLLRGRAPVGGTVAEAASATRFALVRATLAAAVPTVAAPVQDGATRAS